MAVTSCLAVVRPSRVVCQHTKAAGRVIRRLTPGASGRALGFTFTVRMGSGEQHAATAEGRAPSASDTSPDASEAEASLRDR